MTSRRSALSGAAAVLSTLAWPAQAQTASGAPLKLVVPYPPGGFTDVVSRMVGTRLQTVLGQPVVAENRPGAGTNLAAEAVARSTPDGLSMLMGTSSLAINPALYPRLNYSAQNDLRPLGIFGATGFALLASKALPVNSVAELIAYARANPGKLTYGSSGNGAVNHLAGELFKSMSRTFMVHIPYRGSQAALVDLVGGRIDLYWSSILEALPMISADRVKVLGQTNQRPAASLPNAPPIGQTLKGYEVEFWMGIFVPAATPPAATARVEQALQTVATDPSFAEELNRRGAQARYLNASDARALMASETTRWAAVVKASGATVD